MIFAQLKLKFSYGNIKYSLYLINYFIKEFRIENP